MNTKIPLITYNEARRICKTGDQWLIKGAGLFSWLIQLVSVFSHAALVLRISRYQGLAERVLLAEAVGRGVVASLMSKRTGEVISAGGEVFLFCPNIDDKYRDLIMETALINTAEGLKYDYSALLANIIGRVSLDAKKYICSEFSYMKLKEAGALNHGNLTREGVLALKAKVAPRPGDIPNWIRGTMYQVVGTVDTKVNEPRCCYPPTPHLCTPT
jgi:hypothetical protein